jgi:DNA polymerase-3 subunit delta
MASSSPAAIRKQVGQRKPDPVYLIVGDDDAEMSELTAALSNLIDDELRAFNLERLYANDKGVSPFSIVQAARTLPMLGDRRVVVVLRAEAILKPKRGGAEDAEEAEGAEGAESAEATKGAKGRKRAAKSSDLDELDRYIKQPEPTSVLVLVASDVDRQRRIYKTIQQQATVVECWGLKGTKDGKVSPWEAARAAETLVKQAVNAVPQQIDAAAVRLVASRAGTDISRLRADIDRLLLYAAGKPKITLQDAQEVVSGETAQDDWAVTNAIAKRDAAEALRQIALSLDSGGVSYQILGQLAWFVREKMTATDPRRVPAAIDALFRTDLELKSSGGDPRILLERLVVELCRR